MIGKFFHTPKSKPFYIPYRYYSPEKEAMQEREQRIRRELGIVEEKEFDANYKANLKGSFRQAMNNRSRSASDAQRRSNTRLIIMVLILALVFYLLFFYF
ncbi:MAG: hypothetical protein RBS73_02685 [Prolixibacteraceae bacterium]|jgi:hypothetical protein|nr:hypothetical protein [Prolixibacteraceae bacterium]